MKNKNKNFSLILLLMTILFFFLSMSLESVYLIWYIISIILVLREMSHFTMILLCLEIMTMISLIVLTCVISKIGMEMSILFLYLCLAVGEAALGLSLLIFSTRHHSFELMSTNLI